MKKYCKFLIFIVIGIIYLLLFSKENVYFFNLNIGNYILWLICFIPLLLIFRLFCKYKNKNERGFSISIMDSAMVWNIYLYLQNYILPTNSRIILFLYIDVIIICSHYYSKEYKIHFEKKMFNTLLCVYAICVIPTVTGYIQSFETNIEYGINNIVYDNRNASDIDLNLKVNDDNIEEIKNILYQLELSESEFINRPKQHIIFVDEGNNNLYGYYKNAIYLNLYYFKNRSLERLLSTYYHESFYSKQFYLVDNSNNYKNDPLTISIINDYKKEKYNYHNGMETNNEYEIYANQKLERDANAYSRFRISMLKKK